MRWGGTLLFPLHRRETEAQRGEAIWPHNGRGGATIHTQAEPRPTILTIRFCSPLPPQGPAAAGRHHPAPAALALC